MDLLKQLRQYNSVPRDPVMSSEMYNFLTVLLGAVQDLQGTDFPLLAPDHIIVHNLPGAVHIHWGEVDGAIAYNLYESPVKAYSGTLFHTVVANKGGRENTFTRTGIADQKSKFYYVVPLSSRGIPGNPSQIAEGHSTTTGVNHGDAVDVLTNNLFSRPTISAVNNVGQIIMSSPDVIGKPIIKSLGVPSGSDFISDNGQQQIGSIPVSFGSVGMPMVMSATLEAEMRVNAGLATFNWYMDGPTGDPLSTSLQEQFPTVGFGGVQTFTLNWPVQFGIEGDHTIELWVTLTPLSPATTCTLHVYEGAVWIFTSSAVIP